MIDTFMLHAQYFLRVVVRTLLVLASLSRVSSPVEALAFLRVLRDSWVSNCALLTIRDMCSETLIGDK